MYNFTISTLKRKVLPAFWVFAFLQISVLGQEPARPLHSTAFKLQGTVKTVDRQTYKALENFEKVEKGESLDHPGDRFLKFDKNGNLIEEGLRLPDGLFLSKELFSYISTGKLKTRSYYDENENLLHKETYAYNEDGQLITRKLVDGNDVGVSEIDYIITEGGKHVKMIGFEEDAGHGETNYQVEFRYDEKPT